MKLRTVFRTLLSGGVSILASGSFAAEDLPVPADLIIFNAKVITVNSNFSVAQALAIRGDKIVAVGKDKQMDPFKGADTQMLDAQGKTIMPGFYDNDVRSYKAATSELDGPLPVFNSIAGVQEYIRKQVAEKPPGSWIIIDRVYPTRLMEGRFPTKKELDAAAPQNPVFWNSGPVSVVNSKALEVSKITGATTNPPSGEIVRDPKTHLPTGLLRNASSVVKLPQPTNSPTAEQTRDAVKHLHKLYNQQGITSIGENFAGPGAIDLFRDLAKDGELTVRVNCTRVIEPGTNPEEALTRLDAITNSGPGKLPYGPTGVGDDWVRIGSLNVVMDGTILVGDGYLRTPWGIGPTYQINEPSYCGTLFQDPEVVTPLCLEAAGRGWQLSGHCTGDAATDALLNIYERISFKMRIKDRRFQVMHSNFMPSDNWSRFRKLGVTADIQSAWLYKDGASLIKTLGQDRMTNFLPLKSCFENGVVVGGGSDHTAKLDSLDAANPWNPWLGLWVALTRQTVQGAVINPAEKLSREQAIRLYTINNAYLNFEEQKKGSLEPGKYADLIIVDTDLLACWPDDVLNTKVLLTMVGGKVVWLAKANTETEISKR